MGSPFASTMVSSGPQSLKILDAVDGFLGIIFMGELEDVAKVPGLMWSESYLFWDSLQIKEDSWTFIFRRELGCCSTKSCISASILENRLPFLTKKSFSMSLPLLSQPSLGNTNCPFYLSYTLPNRDSFLASASFNACWNFLKLL